MEAIRQMIWRWGKLLCYSSYTFALILNVTGELKTKPNTALGKTMLEYGVQPDILVCRSENPLEPICAEKLLCSVNVNVNAVIEVVDASSILMKFHAHAQRAVG